MLSLVGSIQPDPFSPEHTPQVKPDQAQSPEPPPHPVLPDPAESDAADDEELDVVTARLSPAAADKGKRRRKKEGNEEMLATREKGGAVTKSEHRQKRKKAS
jgi:DNA-directed RNA polymerase I subunit RPA43